MNHYRIYLWGYGGEAAYIGINKEQYEYWSALREDYEEGMGESHIIDYMVDPEEFLDNNEIPEAMDFMKHTYTKDDGTVNEYYNPWNEAPNEFAHQWGVGYNCCRVTVQEVESDEYNATAIGDEILDGQDASDIAERLEEEHGIEFVEHQPLMALGSDTEYCEMPDYVCQFWSAEKGTFYEGTISIDGDFDVKKLKLITNEFPNGDDTVVDVQYDGESVDNLGGDTNGKGYSVHFWSNVDG